MLLRLSSVNPAPALKQQGQGAQGRGRHLQSLVEWGRGGGERRWPWGSGRAVASHLPAAQMSVLVLPAAARATCIDLDLETHSDCPKLHLKLPPTQSVIALTQPQGPGLLLPFHHSTGLSDSWGFLLPSCPRLPGLSTSPMENFLAFLPLSLLDSPPNSSLPVRLHPRTCPQSGLWPCHCWPPLLLLSPSPSRQSLRTLHRKENWNPGNSRAITADKVP